MNKKTTKNQEYYNFSKIAKQWWEPNGKFKILHQITPIRLKYILDNSPKKQIKNLSVLDLGCGGGLICEPLARLKAKVTGIDFIKENIQIAKNHAVKSNLKINYINSDLHNFVSKKKYDLILMLEILEHLEDWKKFLINIKRSLKPNGIIILSTINKNIISKYSAIYFAENILNWIPKGTHDFNKFIKPEEIINGLKKEKIKVIDLKGLIFNPLISNWHLSNNKLINYFCTLKMIN